MGSLFEPGEQVSRTEISPEVKKYANPLMDALMMIGAQGPVANMYRGPTVAAMNPAQLGVMDSTAAAGNAFGIPMGSASAYVPTPNYVDPETGIAGHTTHDMAIAGISPEMQAAMSRVFGPEGFLTDLVERNQRDTDVEEGPPGRPKWKQQLISK